MGAGFKKRARFFSHSRISFKLDTTVLSLRERVGYLEGAKQVKSTELKLLKARRIPFSLMPGPILKLLPQISMRGPKKLKQSSPREKSPPKTQAEIDLLPPEQRKKYLVRQQQRERKQKERARKKKLLPPKSKPANRGRRPLPVVSPAELAKMGTISGGMVFNVQLQRARNAHCRKIRQLDLNMKR
jgi:hypothetical protein